MEESASISWGKAIDGLCLGISVEEPSPSGEKVLIARVVLKNQGPDPIEIVRTHVLSDLDFEVLRRGEPVIMTSAGEKALHAARTLPPAGRGVIIIQPGEIQQVDPPVILSQLYRIEKPGTYKIRAFWRNPGHRAGLSSGPAYFVIDESG